MNILTYLKSNLKRICYVVSMVTLSMVLTILAILCIVTASFPVYWVTGIIGVIIFMIRIEYWFDKTGLDVYKWIR